VVVAATMHRLLGGLLVFDDLGRQTLKGTRLASPSLAVARVRPTERMTSPRPQAALLGGEQVLDRDSQSRPARVAADHVRRHRFAARLRSLELRHQPRRASCGCYEGCSSRAG
jgi:hypothetical protein